MYSMVTLMVISVGILKILNLDLVIVTLWSYIFHSSYPFPHFTILHQLTTGILNVSLQTTIHIYVYETCQFLGRHGRHLLMGFLTDSGHALVMIYAGIVDSWFPLTSVAGKTSPAFPAHAQPAKFNISGERPMTRLASAICTQNIF